MSCATPATAQSRSLADLQACLEYIKASPADNGTLALIVRRPAVDAREVIADGELTASEGLAGDSWSRRGSSRSSDGGPHPDMQLNLMNARVIEAVAGPMHRWPLAGDQLFVDLDLSQANVPPGTQLAIGAAVIEVTAQPHTGCGKFAARFGVDALKWVNSAEGRALGLRGINARVMTPGRIQLGDAIRKVSAG